MRADAVHKRYGRRQALRGVSFDAGEGEVLAIIGPNGAGKTTLLSVLAGLTPPTSGSVSRPPGDVGWVPQQTALYGKLSVGENLRLFARLERLDDVDGAVAAMLDLCGLQDRAREELGRLSGGNQQRVNIAAGLLSGPPVLLLDEPSSSLDPRQRARLWALVDRLVAERRTTVIFTTHDVAEAEHHADRVLVLADGSTRFEGTPAELHAVAGGEGDDFERAFVRFLERTDPAPGTDPAAGEAARAPGPRAGRAT